MGNDIAIVTMNRSQAGRWITSQPHAIVSITDPKSELLIFPGDLNVRRGVLRLQFYDVDVGHEKFFKEYPPMSDTQADEVWLFVDRMIRAKVEILLIHCEAGISRSPAVAAAISKYLGREDCDWFKYYLPNRHVYRTMLGTMPVK